jgi:hypothetical protein
MWHHGIWYIGINVSEEPATFIFKLEEYGIAGSSETLKSISKVHGVTYQKSAILIHFNIIFPYFYKSSKIFPCKMSEKPG